MSSELWVGSALPTSADDRPVVLYQSDRTRVTRVRLPGVTAIRKEALGRSATARIQHELSIMQRLAAVPGVIRPVAEAYPDGHSIVFEDVAGRPLADVLRSGHLLPAALPQLALALARIIADVHRAGVVHRDVNPANILLAGTGSDLLLIDFDLATTFAEVRPGFTHHRDIVGRLPYLAPEQTGRTGLPVDLRADLYALGATLYEVAAGYPPFGDGDPLQLVRDILAREPQPLAEVVPGISQGLSDVVARLLEKEPERRYQSADGLAHDLSLLCENPSVSLRLGERDFPTRLSPPSGLVGRDTELNMVRTALDNALTGPSRGLLVTGAPGVGKSALIAALRPMVTARGGWFVSGKADQYRRDTASGVVVQALSGLGRLLLAEPEAELAAQREGILQALGVNAGLITAAAPEFATLLGADHQVVGDDPVEVEARLRQAALDLLGVVASPDRPIVLFLDDLQWASASAIGILDAIQTDADLRGLLLVGAYREREVDAAHPLTAVFSRWEQLGVAPQLVRLDNLPAGDLSALVGQMLRLPAAQAAALATLLGEHTGGNPFDTVELVNALRRDGALVLSESGWSWEEASIRRYVGHGDVVDLLKDRIERLAGADRETLEIMACLGGEVSRDLLAAASGRPPSAVPDLLAAALEDGLLVMDEADGADPAGGSGAVRFRHDRVQQAARAGLDPGARSTLQLAIARRLATRPEFRAQAAEQYLVTVDALHDGEEQRLAAALFEEAATGATRISNHAIAERYLATAVRLRRSFDDAPANRSLVRLETAWHSALYSLGRLDEADDVYRSIERRCDDPIDLVDAAGIQICSLTNRQRPADGVVLGFALLERLGFAVPGENVHEEIQKRNAVMYEWIDHVTVDEDLRRPELSDRRALAASRLLARIKQPAFFAFMSDQTALPWLITEAQRLWDEYGPCAPLVSTIAAACFSTIMVGDDFATGVRLTRHALAVGEGRRYGPVIAEARYLYAVSGCHWFEPIEEEIRQGRAAREALQRIGDLQSTCLAFWPSIFSLLDCGPTLADLDSEVDAAVAFAERTGNDAAAVIQRGVYRQFVRALSGETVAPGSFTDATFDESTDLGENPRLLAHYHVYRALSAALFGDAEALARHAEMAMRLNLIIKNLYPSAVAHLLRALAMAHRIQTVAPDERSDLLFELDRCREWLAQRAQDAPENFGHLLRLVEAERAWAVDDFRGAATAFDAALREAELRQRPWHRALIAERAALFHLAHGLERTGRGLLAEARQRYAEWGAAGKVRELDRTHPFLRHADAAAEDTRPRRDRMTGSSVSSDNIDMLAILRASQALSSETDLGRLYTSVTEQMRSITGATGVRLLLFDDEAGDWVMPVTGADGGGTAIPVQEAGERGLLALTAFRYAERTREPLLVENAARDDRFARDPYFAGLDRCSMLVVPILNQGTMRAALLLENRLSSGAFSADRLDAVMLIAGQLAVSLDNALLYRRLEDKVADRTRALQAANEQLEALSLTDPLTGLANRRRFDDVLEAAWQSAAATGTTIGIAMIDIDHFKWYNDEYGHLAGDECLRMVARALAGSVREGVDLVCRYGGEEFAIILPGADAARANEISERARSAVAALAQPHARSELGFVTLSAGAAIMTPAAGYSADALVNAADTALYQAKQYGRNRVRVAGLSV
ncbi:diguanylate cyclase [Planosporangium flavigriseum]|uniref:Serine/threonine protein kinase n=1 Tax=Planosporangium flavigriseum TaxID=373681 RepID=A0A8J3PM23_9ACTN|nr:diguanylate cyclase [Planosporangium flavigriseum]NJC63087.1 diguanylate cyclase [Planosporangium flavigriseum]GIG74462.1 serine/threonine protein kinase [Planosporangium flavigriseum]